MSGVAGRVQLWTVGALCVIATPASAASVADANLVRSAAQLSPGQYAWPDDRANDGRISIVVSIPLQQIFVYRGATLIAVSSVSTGRTGHETPTGSFSILQKAVTHHSSRYDNAPMPYMERLTWDGIAIHAGYDPGHADSHGCVRVPLAFAKKLYDITRLGGQVSIIGDATAPGLPVDYVRVRAPRPEPAVIAAPASPAADAPTNPAEAAPKPIPGADATRAANLGEQAGEAASAPPSGPRATPSPPPSPAPAQN